MKYKCHAPRVTCFPTLTNYTYGVVSMKNLSYNNSSDCHAERLVEKTFKSLKVNFVLKTTFTTL